MKELQDQFEAEQYFSVSFLLLLGVCKETEQIQCQDSYFIVLGGENTVQPHLACVHSVCAVASFSTSEVNCSH